MTEKHLWVMVIAFVLGAVFFVSAIPKLRHPKGFVLITLDYQVLPPALAQVYGWALPPIELWCALLLLTGIGMRVASIVAAFLLLSFIFAVSINLLRGRDLDCHCFGTKVRRRIGPHVLLQDVFLLSMVLTLILLESTWTSLEPWSITNSLQAVGLPHFNQASSALVTCGGIAGCGMFVMCVVGILRVSTQPKHRVGFQVVRRSASKV